MAPGSDPTESADSSARLRRLARLDRAVRVGFWITASSVVLMLFPCLGCSVFLPSSARHTLKFMDVVVLPTPPF